MPWKQFEVPIGGIKIPFGNAISFHGFSTRDETWAQGLRPRASPHTPEARTQLQLSEETVIHSFRHSFLTRLGESGVDVFSIMKIAGHSSVKVSERYVHPSSESVERAFARLQEFNDTAVKQLPATVVDSGNKALAADEHKNSSNQSVA
jgi:hypothetical protein